MAFRKRREALRSILSGSSCIRPGSVYDAISIRIAEDLGFELGMFGGSVASLAVLGDPDVALITLTELAEQMRRMSRAATLPVLVDADHGYGNALNVRRTVQELEAAGAAGLTIEDTLLPQAFGQSKAQLISLEEGVGKMKAALDGRSDPSLVIMARTGAASISGLDDAIARARAYDTTGVDALFFTGLKNRAELEAVAAATKLPIVLGGFPEEMIDLSYLRDQRVRIALQGHAPFAAATQAFGTGGCRIEPGGGVPARSIIGAGRHCPGRARPCRCAEFAAARGAIFGAADDIEQAGYFDSFGQQPDRHPCAPDLFCCDAEDKQARSGAIADPPSALPRLPSADADRRGLARSGRFRAPHLRVCPVRAQRDQNGGPRPA